MDDIEMDECPDCEGDGHVCNNCGAPGSMSTCCIARGITICTLCDGVGEIEAED